MTVEDKLQQIFDIIKSIEVENDPGIAAILMEGFGLSMNIINAAIANGGRRDKIDISEHLEIVSSVLGVSVKDLVMKAIDDINGANNENLGSKAPDQSTLDFITSGQDLDDYEKFLAQNKAKEDLDFLSKEI